MNIPFLAFSEKIDSYLHNRADEEAKRMARVQIVHRILNPSSSVGPYIAPSEVDHWIRIVGEVYSGQCPTALHRLIERRLSPDQLEFVATGKVSR